MKKKVMFLLCALVMVLAMSMTAMAAPSPEFPDPDYLYEDPTESETTTDTPSAADTEPDTEPVTKPVKKPVKPNDGDNVKDFPDTEYLYDNPDNKIDGNSNNNAASTGTGKSDTSPKTGESMAILYVAMAAMAFAGTAYAAKKRLSTEE